MREQILLENIYHYYPKEIMPTDEAFFRTAQHFSLRKLLKKGHNDKVAIEGLVKHLSKEFPEWDTTDLESELNYPCYTIQCIFDKSPNTVKSFIIYISLIIPVHSIYQLQMSSDKLWVVEEITTKELDINKISAISTLVRKNLNTLELLAELLHRPIKDIWISENFTIFNALYVPDHKLI